MQNGLSVYHVQFCHPGLKKPTRVKSHWAIILCQVTNPSHVPLPDNRLGYALEDNPRPPPPMPPFYTLTSP